MRLLYELQEYYNTNTVSLVTQRVVNPLEKKSDTYKKALFDVIAEMHSVSFGFPDIAIITKAMKDVRVQNADEGRKQKCFSWSVCMKCGALYGVNMMCCPKCYEKGEKVSVRFVGFSTDGYKQSIINYNDGSFTGLLNGKSCYTCNSRENSFCSRFGRLDKSCNAEEWGMCACRECCALVKKSKRGDVDKNKITYF